MTKKLRYLCTLLLCMIASVGWAEETTVTFDLQSIYSSVTEWVDVTKDSQDGVTLTYSRGTGSDVPCYFKNGSALRFYKNNTFTVSSQSTITKIVMTSSNSTLGNFSTTTGSYSKGTWTGSAKSIVFNVSAAARLTKVVVTLEDSTPAEETSDVKTLTFDVSANPGDWPTDNSTTLKNYTYTLNNNNYTFALMNVKCNSGYLMMTATAVLGLPAIQGYKLTKVVASNSGGCSTATKVGISSSASEASYIAGGASQTWSTQSSSYTYNLTSTEENTMYYLYVTNKNAQVTNLELTYEFVDASAPQLSADNVDLEYDATNGTIIYTLTNPVDGGVVTANTTADWLTISAAAGNSIPFTCTANAAGTERSATVTLTYTYNTNETITKDVTVTQAAAPTIYTTIPDLFAAATSTATAANVTFNNWVVSGVSTDGKSVFVTDNDGNGFMIYSSSDQRSTYSVGDILSGNAVSCELVLYNGSAELKNLNASDLTITTGGTVPTSNIAMADLAGKNTGALVSYEHLLCSINDNKYYLSDGTTTIQVYNALFAFDALEEGKTYNITGVYQQFNNTKEILPRSADDIVEYVAPKHMAVFYVNGTKLPEVEVSEGKVVTFPEVDAEINGKKFVGWVKDEIKGVTDEAPTFVTSHTMGEEDVVFYAVYATQEGDGSTTTDVLTLATTGVSGTEYKDWNDKAVTSSAVYAGQSAGGNESIQLRSSNNNSGVITTTSGGKATKVAVVWNNATADGRALNVYGKNSAYSAATDLYGDNAGTLLGTIVKGTSTELTITGDYEYIGLRSASGAMYLGNITITWESGTPATYSGYCTTVVAPVKPAKPIVFHDGGEGVTYEGELTVPMFAEEGATIYYTTDGSEPDVQNAEQAYSGPVSLPVGETTVKAIAVKDGVESDVVTREYRIEAVDAPDINLDGYYSIKNNNGNYVNVAGRKTVTFVDKNTSKTAAGTVIRVKTTNGKVEVLRSQGVDVPRYAERAMSYVPELVKELMKRLSENVENPIIGEDGANLITDEVMDLDYNLYLEEADGGYRIYGKTPSMQRVVDFYATNKTIIDERLPRLEEFVEDVLLKVAERLDHPNSEWASKFKILDIWAKLVVTNPDLTKPEEGNAEAISKFYTEILSSEANIWNFAHETMMIYWTKVDQLINDPESQYASMLGDLGDYKKYLEKVPNILPNFKYYIVSDGSGIDFISEGNEDIINDAARTVWTLEGRENFNVTLPVEKVVNIYPTSSGGTTTTYNEYYGTLYTDFAYQLPADVVAYKIDGIDVVKGKAYIKKTKLENILPAQTPVMLVSNTADIELTLVAGDVAAVSEGELRGNDYLINEYEINSSQAEGIMMILQKLSESLYNEYEHLQRRNAGTVNNKYFFGLAVDPDLGDAYKAKTGNEMENTPVRVLTKKEDGTIAFTESWNTLAGNESFIFNEEYSDILLSRVGDVNRDGQVTIADVTALVNIVLGKVTYPANADKYDFEAANVNGDEQISIADVTALVNIILGK